MGYSVKKNTARAIATKHCAWLLLLALLQSSFFFPAPAHAFFGSFTIKDEAELGKKFSVLIKSYLPIVQDPEVESYITELVARMSKQLPPQPFPFTTSVVRHNSVNAFASPGGYLFVYTGLILAMDSESELAAVIAHEMAHVTQRHIAGRIENSKLTGILSILGALAGAFVGGDGGAAMMHGSLAAGQSAMLEYSRTDESEADQVGMNYLLKAGFAPQGMVNAFKVLGKKQWIMGGNLPTYLSTHPGIHERVDTMSNRVAAMPQNITTRQDNNARFKRIQILIRAKYNDPDIANPFFANALAKEQNPLLYMGQGILWSRQNKIADASAAFGKALELAPKEQLIMREAGRFHYAKGNKDLGISLLQKAIAAKPNDTMALFFYSQVLADQGNYAEAISYTTQVLRTVPEDTEVHETLGRYYGQNKQLFKAYVHMTYAALYANNESKVKTLLEKTKSYSRTQAERDELKRLEERYKERKEFWK